MRRRSTTFHLATMTFADLFQDPEIVQREQSAENGHASAGHDGGDFGGDGPGAVLLAIDVDQGADEAGEGVEAAGSVGLVSLSYFICT